MDDTLYPHWSVDWSDDMLVDEPAPRQQRASQQVQAERQAERGAEPPHAHQRDRLQDLPRIKLRILYSLTQLTLTHSLTH